MDILFYILLSFWSQTDWSGGSGQGLWSDTTKFFNKSRISNTRISGCILLDAPGGWSATGVLEGANNIWALLETQDSIIYVGGDSAALKGYVFSSDNLGNTWTNTNLPTCNWVHSLIEYHTGTIYAGTDQGVLKYDGSWSSTGLSEKVNTLIETSDSILYAGTFDGKIYKSQDGSSWAPVTVNNALRIWDIIEVSDTLYAAGTREIGANEYAGVFKSVDGITFDTTCFPHIDRTIYSLLYAADAKIYAGTGPDSGEVFKTSDGGSSWAATQKMEYAECVYSLLQNDYGTIYAGTGTLGGYLYKTTNGGVSWAYESISPTINSIYSLLQSFNSFLFVGATKGVGSNSGVWKAGYYLSGGLKSSSYEAYTTNEVNYDSVIWDVDLHSGNIEVWVRTNTIADMYGVDSFRIMNSGDTIPAAFDNKRYIQYQVKLLSPTVDSTPIFKEIKIYYRPGVGVEDRSQKTEIRLEVYPNPTLQVASIRYQVVPAKLDFAGSTSKGSVKIGVYDASGRLVKNLVNGYRAGSYQVDWDTEGLAGGVYFIKLDSDNYRMTKKLILLK
ncbi:MAG: T9SS type A sorting domain-containing protein [Candidatus Stahlbacteria bacterium]|nr:T9SS type A sorting domain-containing protein [Candidatus Stahlbacteria bacterium]